MSASTTDPGTLYDAIVTRIQDTSLDASKVPSGFRHRPGANELESGSTREFTLIPESVPEPVENESGDPWQFTLSVSVVYSDNAEDSKLMLTDGRALYDTLWGLASASGGVAGVHYVDVAEATVDPGREGNTIVRRSFTVQYEDPS